MSATRYPSEATIGAGDPQGVVSVVARETPARDVLSDLGYQAGVPIIVSSGVEGRVDIELADVELMRAVRAVASQVSASVSVVDGVITVGGERKGDVIRIIDPGFFDADDAAEILGGLLGDDAEVRAIGGRLFASLPASALETLREAEGFLRVGPDAWAVTIQVYEVGKDFQRRSGIDWSLLSEASLGLSMGSEVEEPGVSSSVVAAVTALGEWAADGSDVELMLNTTLYVVEGFEAKLQRGDVLRIPRRTVSPQGTSTTTDFTVIETGLTIDLSARRVPGGALLGIRPSISDVAGFVDSAPTVTERSIETTALVRSGDYIVLTGLDSFRSSEGEDRSGMPFGSRSFESSERTLVFVCRAVRVASAQMLTMQGATP